MNLDEIRRTEFPWTVDGRGVIYLNHASTGPLPQRTLRALAEANLRRSEPWRLTLEHQFGVLAHTRDLIGRLIGASPSELAVMTNTSHGINLAERALPWTPWDVVLSFDREVPARDHDAVRGHYYLLDVVYRFVLLDLGDNGHVAAELSYPLLDLPDLVRGAHKGHRHPVGVELLHPET